MSKDQAEKLCMPLLERLHLPVDLQLSIFFNTFMLHNSVLICNV